MNSTLEDAVLNFDLDFLHPTTNNIPVHALKQRYIGQVKKRIIRVDALHNHCNSLKLQLCNKNKELELTKKKLASTTQEYTQTSLEYKEALESFSKCEKECQGLKQGIKDFQDKYFEAINNVEAGRSHIVQLQQLVKQHERNIEMLQKNATNKTDKTIRETLEKELLLLKKSHKKVEAEWQVKYDKLLKQLEEAKCSKEKLKEELLVKNDKLNNEISDFISYDEHSENEDDCSDDFISGFSAQVSSQNKVDMSLRCPMINKDDLCIVNNNNLKNDIVSVDTGCGSSLASSLSSPDFLFSPINGGSLEINHGHKLVNTATSPISLVKMTEIATSPPPAVKMIDVGTSPIAIKVKNQKNFGTQTESVITNNIPVKGAKLITAISPNKNIANKIVGNPGRTLETLPEIDMNDEDSRAVENIPHIEIKAMQNKHCLELNNSNNIVEDCSNDNEIEMILNTMRLNCKILTPIPKTPKKISENVSHSICQEAAIARDQAAAAKQEAATAREEVAKTREAYNIMIATVTSLVKDVYYIKTILKNKFSMADDALELSDYPLAPDFFKNTANGELNYELSSSNFALNKSDFVESQTILACPSDSHIPVNVSKMLGTSTIENLNIKNDENRALSNTVLEIEDHTDHNISLEEEKDENRVLPNTVLEIEDRTDHNISSEEEKDENRVLPNTVLEIEDRTDHNISSEEENDIICLDCVGKEIEPTTKPNKKKGVKKMKKISNLDKYRKKCESRKYKIREKTPPLRKPRMKPKQLFKRPLLKTTTKSDGTSVTLNDKDVYAKAVKVMAELNAKASKHSMEPVTNTRSEQTINAIENHHSNLECEQNTMIDIKSPEYIVVSEKPATKSPRLAIRSPKSVAHLQSASISPSSEVTSPMKVITTPKHSERSLASADLSPIASMKSPTSVNPPRRVSSKSAPLSPAITSPTSESKSPIHSSISPSTTTSMLRVTRRSLRYSDSAVVSSKPTATFTNSDITDKNPSIKCVEAGITSAVPSMTPKPTITSPMSSSKSAPLSPAITSPTSESKSPIHSSISPSTTTSVLRVTRRSLRYSDSAVVSPKPTATFTNSDITDTNSSIKCLEDGITSAVPSITPKPTITSPRSSVITRSRNKYGRGVTDQCTVELTKDLNIDIALIEAMARKRKLSSSSDTQCKRVLRNTPGLNSEHTTLKDETINQEISPFEVPAQEDISSFHPKESILCVMIQKYAKRNTRPVTRNVPDAVLKCINDKIETFMVKIKETPCNKDNTMIELVEELQKYDYKNFVSGLIKYLTNPDRKMELFGKSSSPPAPQMTRYEAVLLYVIRQLRSHWRSADIVDVILSSIEHTLFKLNRTPDFDVVESVSHFYALVCRYFGQHNRLKVFMLDAMYCILFKSVPLIKQCLEVYPHIIPLAHMSAAKTSLVTIFVYLLHFYKCEDQFNRVQEIRNMLVRKYSYQISEFNENKMLELVSNSIMELKDFTNEQKMLRIALIILGKRHGAKWTQNNIIKKLLQITEKENVLPEHVTAFCVSMIGPLMKPYPADMKVHCEIGINKLVNIMNTTTSKRVEEAAITSLIMLSRHNYQRINEILLSKKMQALSPELEETIRDYVRMRPLNSWMKTLPRLSMSI